MQATSALDSITEQQVQSSLRAIRSHITTIIVAHRLSTVMDADSILVMEGGKIVESGHHQDLLARNGHYARLWFQQHQSDGGDTEIQPES